jgi:hypothetical protein
MTCGYRRDFHYGRRLEHVDCMQDDAGTHLTARRKSDKVTVESFEKLVTWVALGITKSLDEAAQQKRNCPPPSRTSCAGPDAGPNPSFLYPNSPQDCDCDSSSLASPIPSSRDTAIAMPSLQQPPQEAFYELVADNESISRS